MPHADDRTYWVAWQATSDHDLAALVDCFSPDYLNETRVHPARSFRGREQVGANWRRIFAAAPDLRAGVLGSVVDGATVWREWNMTGTDPPAPRTSCVGW